VLTEDKDTWIQGPDGREYVADPRPRPAAATRVPTAEPNRAQRRAGWPKRRQWLDRIATDNRLTDGAKTWLCLLARRSDDAGKPVWGNQVKMADQIGRGDRSVRRYRAEAETLGYVVVYRAKPVRGALGRWCRRKANAYYLQLPPAVTASLEAPRRRRRAAYCVVPSHQPGRTFSPWSHLPDSDGRSTPSGVPTSAAPPSSALSSEAPPAPKTDTPPESDIWVPPTEAQRTEAKALAAQARARLRRSR
jgi:Helix-turn-helix domain